MTSFKDFMLNTPPIRSSQYDSYHTCIKECFAELKCVTVNVKNITVDGQDKIECQLLAAYPTDHPNQLIAMSEYTHFKPKVKGFDQYYF